jgi:prepilin-type processing-associated H-X9-DG protein
VGLVGLAIFALVALLFPVLVRQGEPSRAAACISNQKQILAAATAFAEDCEWRLPPAATWNVRLGPYLSDAADVFHCPSVPVAKGGGYDYAFNETLSGKEITALPNPSGMIMIFDADNGQVAWRHAAGANLGYADGHVRYQRKSAAARLPAVPSAVQAAPRM